MKIVLTGGGSGGHITPLLAVARELKKLNPNIRLIYIGQTGDSLADIPKNDPNIDEVYSVSAGKFRRYHTESVIRQIFDVETFVKNFKDFWKAMRGIGQAKRILKRVKPDIIFVKGGYVGVPVGLAAARLHIKYVTHDSDAIPGLANRIIARWASLHTVALPIETYDYPQDKTVMVGVPVSEDYQHVNLETESQFKKKLGFSHYKRMIFVTGGGLGALRLNEAFALCVPSLLSEYKDLVIVQAAGRQHELSLKEHYTALLSEEDQQKVLVKGYIEDLYIYSGAADLIIARAGATNIAEFAMQAKACILVPNPYLTSGHQLKNAQILSKNKAVKVISEESLNRGEELLSTIKDLLNSSSDRKRLGEELHKFAKPDAASELAELLINTIS